MSNPYLSFSNRGSHSKSATYKPTVEQKMELSKWQKLVINAITETPEITLPEMAHKLFDAGVRPLWDENTVKAHLKKTIQAMASNGELKPSSDGSYSLMKSDFVKPEKKLSIKGGQRL
jgi:N-acetylglucosamine-6-phosphate deacetylase